MIHSLVRLCMKSMRALYRCLLRWAFARFYCEFASTYDLVAASVSRGLWRYWVESVVPQLQGDRVLELGSGTGYLQRALRRAGVWSVGLDASPQMLRLARHKVERAGSRALLLRAYAQQLPFPNSSFSDVVATFPAEYILDPATLEEVWRVLQPGGQVVLINSAQFTRHDAYSAAVAVAYRVTQQVGHDPCPDLLRAVGFEVHLAWVDVKASRVQVVSGVKSSLEAKD
jgi:ubiquinone/menaquinone biosynthesis C-methylase UbiE